MPLVTFTSDFGNSDHYVAYVKAVMLSEDAQLSIVDISHQITSFDISHMAFTLAAVFREFPTGTVHFIGQDEESGYFISWIEGHYFVAPNNGVISLISERRPDLLIGLVAEKQTMKAAAKAAVKLAKGEAPEGLGSPLNGYREFSQRKARATKKEISGHVVRVDHFGNLITNIEKADFDILSKDRAYRVQFSRELLNKVHQQMQEVEPGDAFAKFNASGKLMIGIYKGNGAQLLGLSFDSSVTINFED